MERVIYTAEEINKKLELLPPDVRGLIYSTEMDAALQKVSEKHELHIDQMGSLETETVDTLIGIDPLNTFVERIGESLEVDATKAAAIAEDVNQLLFLKIRASMQKMSEVPPTTEPSQPAAVRKIPVSVSTSEIPVSAPSEVPISPLTPPPAPSHISSTTTTPTRAESVSMPAAEKMLSQATISSAASSTTPASYKIDPYREPPE